MLKTLTYSEAATVRGLLGETDGAGEVSAWAATLLDGIAEGGREIAAVEHPLGFMCIQAYRGSEWGLCVHIWEGAVDAVFSIHSHTWDLRSQVLCGQLEDRQFSVTDTSADPTHRVVEITSDGPWDLIRPTSRLVRRARSGAAVFGAGAVYGLSAGAFHASRTRGLTATALLAHNRLRSPELALGPLDTLPSSVRRRNGRPATVRRLAAAARGAIRDGR